jgi:glyoxylase-like metal-dependent hydrolase (beta-lactamase superfamily II)
VEVAPGLLWLRLPLPFALDHVNVWLIEDGPDWLVIDTGVADDVTRAIWTRVLETTLLGRRVSRILATHFHPDHAGLAGWLVERTGAQLLMPRTEWLTARMLALDDSDEYVAANASYYRLTGLDTELASRLLGRRNPYRRVVSPPPGRFTRIGAGDSLAIGGDSWMTIVGEGHAPEQATLWSPARGLLIAADQLLPRITPIVGVWASQPEADALGDFDSSLERYEQLPDDALVLPSHDRPYLGLHERRAALAGHHRARLDLASALCREPVTTAAVMVQLFPRALDLHQTGFALAETLAHLNRLQAQGRVAREDRSGIWYWRRI